MYKLPLMQCLYVVVLMVVVAVTLFSQPIHQQQSEKPIRIPLEDSYYNWFDNPCGIIRPSVHLIPPVITNEEDINNTIGTFLLQLIVTLNRIEYWIDNFVIFRLKVYFFFINPMALRFSFSLRTDLQEIWEFVSRFGSCR